MACGCTGDACYLDKDGLMKPIKKKKKEGEINKVA
jgi:hypothetical protein